METWKRTKTMKSIEKYPMKEFGLSRRRTVFVFSSNIQSTSKKNKRMRYVFRSVCFSPNELEIRERFEEELHREFDKITKQKEKSIRSKSSRANYWLVYWVEDLENIAKSFVNHFEHSLGRERVWSIWEGILQQRQSHHRNRRDLLD